jgi:dTDP-glucose 4,6-dehydratase
MIILVTGGCGFLGSHFIRARLNRCPDDTITNVDCLTYAGSADNLEEAADDPRYNHLRVDVADPTALNPVLTAAPFDMVIHFAAETHVDRSLEDASAFVRTNVVGTQTLLSAVHCCRGDQSTPAIVIVSTDEVYGPTPAGTIFRPDQALNPTSPYAVSKAAADMLALSHAEHLDLDVTIMRSVNVYGPHQYPEKMIPLFTARALEGKPLPLYGDGRHRRSWLFVDDFVDGLMAVLADNDIRRSQSIWHFGSPHELENRNIAERICALCDADPSLIKSVADRPGHDRRYALDSSQTAATFGWEPRVGFDDGLLRTIDWIRDNPTWRHERTGWTPEFLRED